MKKFFAFFFLLFSPLFSQNEFVRGLYMFQYTAADFQRLRDSFHLNWVQAAVDKWNGSQYVWDTSVLQNNGQLKIAAIIDSTVNTMSAGQHMEFQAEEGSSDPLKSYFGTKTGQRDNTLWKVESGVDPSGYMVQDAVPDNEYRYGQTHYTASFILKRDHPPSGDPLVARLEVWCKYSSTLLAYRELRAISDFSSDDLETKTLEFDITYSPDPLPTPLLQGVLMARTAQPALLTCDGIDIRVYWYGNLTTWLDKVIVEDALGQQLFSGAHDASLNGTIQHVSAYPLVKRLYMRDEPEISSFLSFKYIQEKARLIYGIPSDGTDSGITATNRPYSFERFLVDAQPHELFVNAYPIDADVPIPPSAMSAAEATSVGIAAYSSDEEYTQLLQSCNLSSTTCLDVWLKFCRTGE